jgi:hypothetical protein
MFSKLPSTTSSPVTLQALEVCNTVATLCRRIDERFPGSGLGEVSRQLLVTAEQSAERTRWIASPILPLRIAIVLLLGLLGAVLITALYALDAPRTALGIVEFIHVLEAGINDLLLLGATVFFLVTLENRIKRRRALQAIHELRALAHIIDMHQLTKDPQQLIFDGSETTSSPKRRLTAFELGRYLDYCSELLSLTGKVAALYVQHFEDAVALNAVTDVQQLTSALSGKIWQKLVILSSVRGFAAKQ